MYLWGARRDTNAGMFNKLGQNLLKKFFSQFEQPSSISTGILYYNISENKNSKAKQGGGWRGVCGKGSSLTGPNPQQKQIIGQKNPTLENLILGWEGSKSRGQQELPLL